jgi:membrane-associated HD superfamily phosphohydrolase
MAESIDKSTHLTQQWLAEIQSLKQQLVQLQSERDEAWESSQKWRQLYNTEAEQRRNDAQMSKQAIASIKLELRKLQGIGDGILPEPIATTIIQQEITQLTSVEELQAKLITVTKERDRLLQALKTEQDDHAQTRKSLTTALGDAIDSMARQKSLNGE